MTEQVSRPTIEQEFGPRENRLATLFHYGESHWQAYLKDVPNYIPIHLRENIAKRIANIRSLVVRAGVEDSQARGLGNLSDIRKRVRYGKDRFNGYNWMLAVAAEPLKGKLAVGESEFAVTDGSESVYQNRVGGCTGIILHDERGEVFSAHI